MTIAYLILIVAILGLTLLPIIRGKHDRVSAAFLSWGLLPHNGYFAFFTSTVIRAVNYLFGIHF